MKVLVTGGAGFIGSTLVRQLLAETDHGVVNVDAMTYAGHPASIADVLVHPRHHLERVDIRNRAALDEVFDRHAPDHVIHLAAESHVDRSVSEAAEFATTNVIGTLNLLEAATRAWSPERGVTTDAHRFLHVSTDEVYGDLSQDAPPFNEESPYRPSSPYAASKASSDHFVRAWHRTHGLPTMVTNCTNNFGPRQYPEKLFPVVILNALRGEALPVYGNGQQVRDWLHVDDHARALRRVLDAGRIGATYGISARNERTNLEVVQAVCRHLDALVPDSEGPRERLVRHVTDRPGHDLRYALDASRTEEELGWRPLVGFDEGVRETVRWYVENLAWVDEVRRSGASWLDAHYDRLAARTSGQPGAAVSRAGEA